MSSELPKEKCNQIKYTAVGKRANIEKDNVAKYRVPDGMESASHLLNLP